MLNVNSKSQVTVEFNNSITSNFSYNNTTNNVAINLNLISGNNVLKITATNQAGFDAEETIIKFETSNYRRTTNNQLFKP